MKILNDGSSERALPALPKTAKLLPDLLARMERVTLGFAQSGTDNLGHLEEALLRPLHELGRAMLEEAAQKKADGVAVQCPCCAGPLIQKRLSPTTISARFGPLSLQRMGGQCRKCQERFYPADAVLGIEDGQSPFVREMAALYVSKMPAAEAAPTLLRATGLALPRSTLGRIATAVGVQAQVIRKESDRKVVLNSLVSAAPAVASPLLKDAPFTLVLMIDSWNIRERGLHWGSAASMRAAGKKPEWWHWVYAGTVFRLCNRVQTKAGRPLILSRGYASTRGGIDALREQLHAEAIRHGLGRAARILVVADGAVWIWNLVEDRFPTAVQRIDLYHVKQHLWAVAAEVFGEGSAEATAWIKPLEEQIESSQALRVIQQLEDLALTLEGGTKEKVDGAAQYFKNNAHRMDYADAKERGEPSGSGAMESTCNQYQGRFKRTGQFWTTAGDEGLMCIQTFWRNNRWDELFPHSKGFDPTKN